MDKVTICSDNVFFLSGIKNILHNLSVNFPSSFSDNVIITDSMEYLNQLNSEVLKSATIVLFVENLQHLSIINHFGFQQRFAMLTLEDSVEATEAALKNIFCTIQRRGHATFISSFTANQVWLTERELDVLMLSCTAGGVDNIANIINVSPKSVLNYRAAALKKMGVNFSASLVRFIRSLSKWHKTSVIASLNNQL